jgi:signal transduction histidine kinase
LEQKNILSEEDMEMKENRLEIRIEDTGCGIKKKNLERI